MLGLFDVELHFENAENSEVFVGMFNTSNGALVPVSGEVTAPEAFGKGSEVQIDSSWYLSSLAFHRH